MTGVLKVIASSTISFLDLGLVTDVTHQITTTTAVAPPTITDEKASRCTIATTGISIISRYSTPLRRFRVILKAKRNPNRRLVSVRMRSVNGAASGDSLGDILNTNVSSGSRLFPSKDKVSPQGKRR
jgi:hypothetical protein